MKAKKIRRSLKDGGVDWREAKHVQGVTKCGKAIYRRMKKKLR